MRNIRILAAVLLLSCTFALSAQIRESVVLVEPKVSEDGTAVFREIASFFKSRGLGDLGQYFEERSKNAGSGSGFLTLDPYGRRIIVTNRHVMAFADSATATITREEGENLKLEDCPLIYEDPNLDLAVLLVPDTAPRDLRLLPFADAVPPDGTEVWTAGYPGLLGKPSWQLAKGVVSNRRVVVEDLGPAEHAVFTQHSAPIDPGNSGGPLLIGNPADLSTIRVVGINTWMVRGRQNANFAVHLEKLRAAIGGIRDPRQASDGLGHVREEAARLAASLGGEEWNRFEAGRFISSRLAMRQGWASFQYILDRPGNEDEKKQWAERFLYESPEETLRQAVYFRIWQSMRRGGASVTLGSVEEGKNDAGETYIRATFTSGRNTYHLDWFEYAGTWRIRSGDVNIPLAGLDGKAERTMPKAKELKLKEKLGFSEGWLMSWGMRQSGDVYDTFDWDTKIGYFHPLAKGFAIGGSVTLENVMDRSGPSEDKLLVAGLEMDTRFGFGIPIRSIKIIPFIDVGYRFELIVGNWNGNETGTIGGSLPISLGCMVKARNHLSIGLTYGWKIAISGWDSSVSTNDGGFYNAALFIMF